MSDKKFQEKVVIVTGATSGIGAATAQKFAAEGARVVLVGRNEERGAKVVERILKTENHEAKFICCDITDPNAVQKLREKIGMEYGRADVLFNNAGIFVTSHLENLDFGDLERTFATNMNGALYMTKYFLDLLSASHGNIVNNASIAGLQSFTRGKENYMYGASKAALIKFSKLCALNYAKDIRVNVICPGVVDTEIFTNRDFSRFDSAIPMGYIAKPEQVAELVLFLASEQASYITGAVIPIDGGMSLT